MPPRVSFCVSFSLGSDREKNRGDAPLPLPLCLWGIVVKRCSLYATSQKSCRAFSFFLFTLKASPLRPLRLHSECQTLENVNEN